MSRKNDQKQLYLFLLLSFFSLCLVGFSRTFFGRGVRGFFERPVLPIQRFSVAVIHRISAPLNWLTQRQSLDEKNTQLKLEIAHLSSQLAEFSVCQEDKEAMRKMLDAPLPPSWHYLPAKAVGVGGRLKINVGARAGVSFGQMVLAQDVLVGRVVSVSPFSSLVELVTDPAVSIPAVTRAAGQKGILAKGIITGFGGNKMILRDILWEEAVGEGDFVYTSGEGEWLANLLVGKVVRVEGGRVKNFREAVVEPFFEIKVLDSVFVVHDYSQNEEEN